MIEISAPSAQALFIEMYFEDTKLSSGTAFVVNSTKGPILVTNRHNFTGRDQITHKPLSSTAAIPNRLKIHHNLKGEIGKHVEVFEAIVSKDGEPLWVEHPTWKGNIDVAAFILTTLDKVELYTFNPSPELPFGLHPSERVSVVGFPFGIRASCLAVWSTGFIASEHNLNYDDKPLFLIDCKTRKGQSGSPVLLYLQPGTPRMINGKFMFNNETNVLLLGIYSGRVNSESELGMVWKTELISQIVQHIEGNYLFVNDVY